jgi:hypothetical protein
VRVEQGTEQPTLQQGVAAQLTDILFSPRLLCCAVVCCVGPGPLLRLQGVDEVLTKAQRYGQPYERYIHSSNIPPHRMQVCAQCFVSIVCRVCLCEQQITTTQVATSLGVLVTTLI